MSATTPYVVVDLDGFDPEALFPPERRQVVIGVRITPVYGQIDLGLLAGVIDEANQRGFALVREQPFKDEMLLCVFDGDEEYDAT